MTFLEILGIGVGLSMDAFAVAIACSVSLGVATKRQLFRLSFHFGLFQALMPITGWFAGCTVGSLMAAWDHWVAFGLLGFIGAKAIYEAFSGSAERFSRGDPTRGFSLVGLSLATSMDAFAVGLSFALLEVHVWYPSLVIGLVTGLLTLLGMLLGRQLGLRFGRRMEILGGLVLIGIGVRILIQHLS